MSLYDRLDEFFADFTPIRLLYFAFIPPWKVKWRQDGLFWVLSWLFLIPGASLGSVLGFLLTQALKLPSQVPMEWVVVVGAIIGSLMSLMIAAIPMFIAFIMLMIPAGLIMFPWYFIDFFHFVIRRRGNLLDYRLPSVPAWVSAAFLLLLAIISLIISYSGLVFGFEELSKAGFVGIGIALGLKVLTSIIFPALKSLVAGYLWRIMRRKARDELDGV